MTFAVVQRELTAPNAEQLIAAFRASPSIVDHDARRTVRRRFGILAENLSATEARNVAGTLDGLGVPAAAVDMDELPALPAARSFKRVDPVDEALTFYDALGRPQPLAWERVVLVAAGQIANIRVERTARIISMQSSHDFEADVVYEHRHVEEHDVALELVLENPSQRWRATADALLFNYLGPRRQARRFDNFPLLVADILQRAPRAAINRGCASLGGGEADPLRHITPYASRQDFEKELVWLLWWSGRGTQGQGG